MRIAINQPCYLPWRGYFALMKMVDVFVFYDDVALPLGRSFQTRVQIKTATGRRWLSLPVRRAGNHGQTILESRLQTESKWQTQHYGLLRDSLSDTPYWSDTSRLLETWFKISWQNLAELTISTTIEIARILGIERKILRSSELGIKGGKTERLVNICKALKGDEYVSPLGSIEYLNHELFEESGIKPGYIEYDITPYHQQFGEFMPYLTAIDLLANTGEDAPNHINASVIPWQEMMARRPHNDFSPDGATPSTSGLP